MDDLAFSDWPGPPVDLSGSNPWLPAYGYQPPTTLLDKDDFIGNPDAALFLQGSTGPHYVFLETIMEETSDDLRSESDRSGSRASPVGWLATDSESGSVIHIDLEGIDDGEGSESETEMVCPAKKRRQDTNLIAVPNLYSDTDSMNSLSRSSSLLQFETLEKHCQDICSSSPSILSLFSQDSLEQQRKTNDLSPDSLEQYHTDSESESDYYKSLKIDLPKSKRYRDSLFYDTKRLSDTDSQDSDETLQVASRSNSCKSVQNLKSCRSFDSLTVKPNKKDKMSAENLSEDSGYSDHLCNYMRNKSSSIPNLQVQTVSALEKQSNKPATEHIDSFRLKNVKVSECFEAYDGESNFQTFHTNFGSSYQDLTVFDRYESMRIFREIGIEKFECARRQKTSSDWLHHRHAADTLNLDPTLECVSRSKFNRAASASVPNLPQLVSKKAGLDEGEARADFKSVYFEGSVCVSSVPKDLNLAGDSKHYEVTTWKFVDTCASIAAKNWDLADLPAEHNLNFTDNFTDATVTDSNNIKMAASFYRQDGSNVSAAIRQESSSLSSGGSDIEMPRYRREGSYVKAVANYLDITDDEREKSYQEPDTTTEILNLDAAIQKAVSESSIKSFNDDKLKLEMFFHSTPISKRTVTSTPNLSAIDSEKLFEGLEDGVGIHRSMQHVPRKSSLADKNNSAAADKELSKNFTRSGSTTSKGVHFCPIVSEVSWKDTSSEDISSYSVSSTPHEATPEPSPPPPPPPPSPPARPPRKCSSHPELPRPQSDGDKLVEFIFIPLNPQKYASSTPTVASPPRGPPPPPPPRSPQPAIQTSAPTRVPRTQTVENHSYHVYKSPPTGGHVTAPHVSSRSQHVNQQQAASVDSMASDGKQQPAAKRARTGKLGGFLSRFASFRFSGRKSTADDKNKKNKKKQMQIVAQQQQQQPVATKDDYIYIPLKGPLPERKAGTVPRVVVEESGASDEPAVVISKPPLPRQAPRVVGACAKRPRADGGAATRGIDSAGAAAAVHRHAGGSMEPMGLIETDLDTEVTVITSSPAAATAHVKTRSLMNLGGVGPPPDARAATLGATADTADRPHKSMEFLLDKQNIKSVEPPENELQKTTTDRAMSEHQLRVQRSLQKLTIPEWYKQNQVPREGFILKKHREPKWTGTATTTSTASKTPSLSSLGSGQSPVLLSPTPHTQPFTRWSTSKLNSAASSPCASTRSSFNTRTSNGGISPCSARSSFSYRQPYLGWRSQERLTRPRTPAERLATTLLPQNNSENPEIQTSIKEVTSAIVHYVSGLKPDPTDHNSILVTPGSSPRNRTVSSLTFGNFGSVASSPGMDNSIELEKDPRILSSSWLENERRSLTITSTPRTELEITPTSSPRLETSPRLKGYENQDTSSQRSASPQSRGSQKLCWLESSFVGTRPLDSPQTPVSLSSETTNQSQMAPPTTLKLDLQKNINNEMVQHVLEMNATRPSPGSTTLEDVLDSLLGLPPSTRAASPSLQEEASANTSPSKLADRCAEQFRRRSEGSEPSTRPATALSNEPPRRVSFHASPPTTADTNATSVKCRYSRCGKITPKNTDAGKKYKNCHNCTYIYCSRECRRAHWEKHRMTCLFSRVGALCRQVLAAAKEHHDFLKQLSLLARQGYLSQGNGAVKCFFSNPECAEKFIAGNIKAMGEPAYVRWADLLPSEMGPNLYSDLIRMCKTYNPDTKFVLYVSVCVVSEVPASGAVKWERQLVSRCAKIRLCRSILSTITPKEPDESKSAGTKAYANDVFIHKSREVSFASIQRQLRQKGVSLKRQFPDVYHKLCAYVDGKSDKFAPVTIYPKDVSTGKSFMCIIMPDVAEPDKLKLKLPTCAD